MNLGFIGAFFAILGSVFLPPGNVEQVYIGWGGLKTLPPTHYRELVDMNVCDNYIIDSKSSEDPRYSTLSVRPGETNYLDNQGSAIRGLWEYYSPSGDTALVMANGTSVYKAGASGWTLLSAGFTDNPWEGYQYSDPQVSRLYLCNGREYNRKYTSSGLFKMQDQANVTTIPGNMTFYYNFPYATADASALTSLEAGQYITWSATAAATDWVEITTIEGNTVRFSTNFPQSTKVSFAVQRSNPVGITRHLTEYDGHIVLGYINQPSTVKDSNISGTEYYNLYSAFGISQSWEASSSYTLSAIRLKLFRGNDISGNILIKIKPTITGTVLASVAYPVSSVPRYAQDVDINFSPVAITSGDDYQLVIERENSSTSPVYVLSGTGGNGVLWTYNSTGFDANWQTGLTTVEYQPDNSSNSTDDNDTDIRLSSTSQTDSGNSNINIVKAYVGYTEEYKGLIKASVIPVIRDNYNNFTKATLSLFVSTSYPGATSLEAKIIKQPTHFQDSTWLISRVSNLWDTAGAGTSGTDFYATPLAVTTTEAGLNINKWATLEVTSLVDYWAKGIYANYGLIVKTLGANIQTYINSSNNMTNKPTWRFTTKTGSVETSQGIYFQTLTNNWNGSKVIYSKRYYPENFPALNTFQVPGQLCGLANSGGYLIVGAKNPDALHYYRFTGDTADGLGIEFINSMPGITFGSAKSIATLPKNAGIIFYSGLGIYLLNGQNIQLLSGDIRDTAKKFSNYLSSDTFYYGGASLQPQGVILPTKDTYLLSVPLTADYNSYIYAYNYANQTWTRWTGLYATSLLTRSISGQEPQLYYGLQNGQVKTQDTTGSTTEEAVLEWYFSGKDITKDKTLSQVELWGVADNPLTNALVTLESTVVASEVPVAKSTITKRVPNNTTTNYMQPLYFNPNQTGKEFKLRLTQKGTGEGTLSWRTIRYKYSVQQGR